MKIEGKAAIVTGGGSGLGAATGQALAEAGAKVALLDLDAEKAKAAADGIGGLGLACDVGDAASAEAAVAAAREMHGPCRILVSCAGIVFGGRIVGRDGPMPLADFESIVRVNLIGTFNLMRLAAADMAGTEPLEDGERGVIISTASIAAFEGQMGQAGYAASKAGVVGLTMPAARELARWGIRVLAIAPGLMDTPMLRGLPEEVRADLANQPLFPKRLGTAEEFARLACHLAENAALNGECIRIDGGMRMQ
jgi:NAD(P)-dependent dehydrogenase (short-subunit alcohol dehydrogenase family)